MMASPIVEKIGTEYVEEVKGSNMSSPVTSNKKKIDLENAEEVKGSNMSSSVKKAVKTKKKLKLVQAEKKIDLNEAEEVEASEMPSFVKFSAPRMTRYLNAEGEWKKKVEPHFPKWKNKTKEEYAEMFNPSHKVIMIVTGKMNNITVFDFDTEQTYHDCIEKYPQLKKALTVRTNKGYHIYCKYNPLQPTKVNTEKHIDVRCDDALAFGHGTETEYGVTYRMLENEKKLDIEMPQEFYDWVFPPTPPPKKKVVSNKKEYSTEEKTKTYFARDVINLINTKILDSMENFRRIVWAMKNCGFTIEDVKELAKKSSHYDEETYDVWFASTKLWNSKTNKNGCKMGTLIHYAKLSDEKKYLEFYLNSKTGDLVQTDMGLARIYLDIIGDNIFYQEDQLYLYTENEWNLDRKGHIVKQHFGDTMKKYYDAFILEKDKKLNEIEGEGNTEEENKLLKDIDEIKGAKKKIESVNTLNNVLSAIKTCMATLRDEIVFDTGEEQKNNVHFQNGVYELNTNTFRPRTKDDFVSMYLSWSYDPEIITEEAREELDVCFRKIEPSDVRRRCLLSYLALSLSGDTSAQTYINLIGYSAANGKSHTFKMMDMCFEFYTKKLSSNIFNEGNAKRHKEMIHLYNKPIRFAYIEELDNKKKLDAEYMKDVIDGTKVPIEVMYGTSVDVPLQAKWITSSNGDPNIKMDSAILRRIVNLYFRSQFVDIEEDDWVNRRFVRKDGAEKMFACPIMKNAVFEMLTNPELKPFFVPPEVRAETQDTADILNEFKNTFEEYYDITHNPEDVVSKTEFMELLNIANTDLKKTISEMRTLGIDYNKEKKKNKVKGCFIGLKRAGAGEYLGESVK